MEQTTNLQKPFANEHSCRLESPTKFKKFRRKNCAVRHARKCIDFIFGIISPKKSRLQAMRYKKTIWSAGDARAHCKSKGGSFEASKYALSWSETEKYFKKYYNL